MFIIENFFPLAFEILKNISISFSHMLVLGASIYRRRVQIKVEFQASEIEDTPRRYSAQIVSLTNSPPYAESLRGSTKIVKSGVWSSEF